MTASNSVSISGPIVVKRDNKTHQLFDKNKIEVAIRRAWSETGEVDESALKRVVNWTLKSLDLPEMGVEMIQDAVELSLIKHKHIAVAKAFMLYRNERKHLRKQRLTPDATAIAMYAHAAKYARYQPMELRREVYAESVARNEAMHLKRFEPLFEADPLLKQEIIAAFDLVRAKRLLPSMRSMQFAGVAIEQNNARGFNCCSTYVDRPRVFGEILYLLLCGCGVGFSVQQHHVEKLPALVAPSRKKVVHFAIQDSIEGWADAATALVQSYLDGTYIEFSYHLIRAEGTPLKTSGGKAPGHLSLKQALESVRGILNGAVGRQLRPIECHDIICLLADAVLAGGIRRSALISLFSPDDIEMLHAKTGDWYPRSPWRANANNSVVLLRKETTKKQIKAIIKFSRQWGEPGFYLTHSTEYIGNPCMEVIMFPFDTVTQTSGFSFCNLTECNAAKFTSLEDFMEVARAATLIGTLQAAYTSFPYLGEASENIARRDALLGVGMTGMLDAPEIALNPEYQRKVATCIVQWNTEFAARLGINSAARTTVVKPSGTTSLILGCVASGHHAHHSRRYIRRVTANENETVFQYFKRHNPHMCVRKPNGDWVIEFPVEAPQGALLKEDIGAVEFLKMVKSTQENWVLPGTAREGVSPGIRHNVSNTVQVGPNEWDDVSDFIWENKDIFTGVSLIASTGDKDYAFAPNEAVTTPAEEARWNQLIADYTPVDYEKMLEMEDGTSLTGEQSCAGGACLV